MPRQARLDHEGMLHHVICRGVARCVIFRDEADRGKFIQDLGALVQRCKAKCLAWSLMPNHFHLLVITGMEPLGKMMQRLLIRYAIYFNGRYRRPGHLFQNRYKAIVCEEEPYLLELVRYIHLNPVRAGLVKDMDGLRTSRLSGHAVIMGNRSQRWQDVEGVLEHYGRKRRSAQLAYERFVAEGIGMGRRGEYSGGGLIRSAGGLREFLVGRRGRSDKVMADERVLGSGEFVSAVLGEVEAGERRHHPLARDMTPTEAIKKAAARYRCLAVDMKGNNRRRDLVLARSLACRWLVLDMGMTGMAAGKLLSMTPSSVTRAVERGRKLDGGNTNG